MVSGYIRDINGIYIWNPSPGKDETVHWTGDSKQGYANGEGQLIWFRGKKEIASYRGYMKHGKPEGFGICKFADGDIYAGQWKNGLRHGKGKHWFRNGNFYSGKWQHDQRTP